MKWFMNYFEMIYERDMWRFMGWYMIGYGDAYELLQSDLWRYDFPSMVVKKVLLNSLSFFTIDCFINDVTFKIMDVNDMQTIWVVPIFIYVSIKLRVHGPTEG